MAQPVRLSTVSGLLIALGLPVLLSFTSPTVAWNDTSAVLWGLARAWGVTLLLLAVVRWWERLPLSTIGLRRPTRLDVRWALIGFGVGGMLFAVTGPLLGALGLGNTNGGIALIAQAPLWVRILVVLTAGIREEILFRGYPIERLAALTGRLPLGAALAYLLFVGLHVPLWGLGGSIQIGLWSWVVTGLYVRRRNLPACMLLHFLNDGFAFLVLPLFM